MKNLRYVLLQRTLTGNGIEVAGIWYQSPALQSLRGDDKITVLIKIDPVGIANIKVWNASSRDWMEVPLAKFERLASEREIEELAYELYRGSRKMDASAFREASASSDLLPLGSPVENMPLELVPRDGLLAKSILGQIFSCSVHWFNSIVLDNLINLTATR